MRNATAIHVVMGLGLLAFLLLCFFVCIIFLIRFYYKDREDELLLGTSAANEFPVVRMQKGSFKFASFLHNMVIYKLLEHDVVRLMCKKCI